MSNVVGTVAGVASELADVRVPEIANLAAKFRRE
jgi:hypothetical protein